MFIGAQVVDPELETRVQLALQGFSAAASRPRFSLAFGERFLILWQIDLCHITCDDRFGISADTR